MQRLGPTSRVLAHLVITSALTACGAALVLSVLACGGESSSAAAWDGVVRDSAGIEIVENFGAPLWPEGPDWKFTQDMRIGAVDGPPEYQFGNITGLQVLSDGRIVVVDALMHNVRFFTAEGAHQMTVGREGQGPGELGSGDHMLLLGPGDTLLVGDYSQNRRVHVLAPNGTWLESFSMLAHDGYTAGYWASGERTGRLTSLHSPILQSDGTRADTLDIVLERDVHGGIVDTLALLPSRYSFYQGEPGTFRRYYNVAWWHRAWGDGHVIARNDQYRFLWHGPVGGLARIVVLAREPLAITDADRSTYMARWDEYLRENSVPADRWSEIKARIAFADAYPAYVWFDNGPAGTLLVERVWPVRDLDAETRKDLRVNQQYVPPGSSEWDVFDKQGRYLGPIVVPGTEWVVNLPPLRFFRDDATGTWYMYSIWSDELDVEYIVRWRIDGRMPD
jgi:hypothetical protein